VAGERAHVGVLARRGGGHELQALRLSRTQLARGVQDLGQVGHVVARGGGGIGGHALRRAADLGQRARRGHDQVVRHDVDVLEHELDRLARDDRELPAVVHQAVGHRADHDHLRSERTACGAQRARVVGVEVRCELVGEGQELALGRTVEGAVGGADEVSLQYAPDVGAH
jgi:hypothetical protein